MSQADSTNTTGAPGVGVEGLYLPTDVSPEQVFQAIGQLRKEARDEIDRLVRFLDKTDDYVSRELEAEDGNDEPSGDDEPSLGSLEGLNQTKSWAGSTGDQWTVDSEKDDCDDEPSLGSIAVGEHRNQEGWTEGGNDDREDEHNGAEPDEDGEPSLGAFEGHDNQNVSWAGETYFADAELDGAESGIGDQGGLDEQVPFLDWQNVGMV
jgi:hypothetical protein